MEEQFIRERLFKLREEKQVSERKMSLDLGHSTSYIRGITSGRSLPSMSEFLLPLKAVDRHDPQKRRFLFLLLHCQRRQRRRTLLLFSSFRLFH